MIEQTIFTVLSTDASVSGLVGNRIYPLRSPQKAEFPLVVYTRVSSARISNLDGENIANPNFLIDCWATSYAQAKTLAGYVEQAILGSTIRCVLNGDREDKNDDIELYRISLDFSVWA